MRVSASFIFGYISQDPSLLAKNILAPQYVVPMEPVKLTLLPNLSRQRSLVAMRPLNIRRCEHMT